MDDDLYEGLEDENNMKEDKILNNSYNTGDIEYEEFAYPMRVHEKVQGQYKENHSENMMEERMMKMLEKDLYEIFLTCEWFNKYNVIKRVDKSDMIKMYYYFKERVDGKNYSTTQFFIGFAEFFQVNYDQLYNEITVKDQEQLLIESERKMKTKKLF